MTDETAPTIVKELLDSVKKAAVAVAESAGLVKLLECVAGLETASVFDLNKRPKDCASDEALLKHIGFTAKSGHFVLRDREAIIDGWRAHVSTWEAPAEPISPRESYKRWEAAAADASLEEPTRVLAAHAAKMSMRPISSACNERVFSFLTQMDTAQRNNMGKKTLATLLFVRGNHHIIDLLTKNKAAEILALPVSARSELRKKRLRESSAAAAALPHKKRARALSAGTGSAH